MPNIPEEYKNNVYYKNLNSLCKEKFKKSANQVICKNEYKDDDDSMKKSNATLTRLYQGNFRHQLAVQQEFAEYFNMSYAAFISYIKYGKRGEECPNGYSAKILREKIIYEEPDYDTLFNFLDITKEEWEKAINGENDFCYDNADALEDYFDLTHGLLRGRGGSEMIDFQKTHAFTPYSHEVMTSDEIEAMEIKRQRERTEENKKLISAALTSYKEVLVIKSVSHGIQIMSGSSDKIKNIRDSIEESDFD